MGELIILAVRMRECKDLPVNLEKLDIYDGSWAWDNAWTGNDREPATSSRAIRLMMWKAIKEIVR